MSELLKAIAKLVSLRPGAVLAHGCFDPLHIGHIRYLEAAREYGKWLIVTVTPDRFVNKPGRPVFNESLRMEALDALRCVDYVALNEWPTAVETIRLLRPAVYVKGGEYKDAMTPALEAEKAAIEEVGGRLVFTDTEQWHSTDLLEKFACASR